MVGGARPVRRADGLILYRNRRVGWMESPRRYRKNPPWWRKNRYEPLRLNRHPPGHRTLSPRKKGHSFEWPSYLSAPISMALAMAVPVTIIARARTVVARGRTAAPVGAATVIHRGGVNHRRRHVDGRRTVVNRGRRGYVNGSGGNVYRRGIHHTRHADGNTHVHSGQGHAGDQQTCGTHTSNKPLFHVAPARCTTQQSYLTPLFSGFSAAYS